MLRRLVVLCLCLVAVISIPLPWYPLTHGGANCPWTIGHGQFLHGGTIGSGYPLASHMPYPLGGHMYPGQAGQMYYPQLHDGSAFRYPGSFLGAFAMDGQWTPGSTGVPQWPVTWPFMHHGDFANLDWWRNQVPYNDVTGALSHGGLLPFYMQNWHAPSVQPH